MAELQPVIRPFETGDEVAINNGFNQAFGLQRPLAEWAWKFPPDPDGRLIMVAEVDGDIIAHYAAVAVRFAVDGAIWRAGQIVDVFSTRAARHLFARRGLWVHTVEAFFDHFGRSGRCPLMFGFPSQRALRLGVLQLGYDEMPLQEIDYLSRPSSGSTAGPRRLLYRAELARDWEPRLDALWRRAGPSYPVAAVRDAEWALRRFAGHPGVRYHRFLITPRLTRDPVAFVVFRSDGGRCRWVDLVWDHSHPGALDLVLHLSNRLAVQTGCEFEELWLNGDPEGRARLETAGFSRGPEPGKLVFGGRAFDPGLDLGSFDGRVYLTMADADLV